jgi:hypothetical protein
MKLAARLIAALVFASTSVTPALSTKSVLVTYEIILKGTDNIPKDAYDAVFSDPKTSFKAIVKAFPGTFFTDAGKAVVDPNGGRRGLLRGGASDEYEHNRDLQIRICSRPCASSIVVTSQATTNETAVRRELFEASYRPSAVNGLEKALSATLSKRMCGKLQDCDVEVELQQVY